MNNLWEETSNILSNNLQYQGYDHVASLHYDDIEFSGPPVFPLEFPTPTVFYASRVTIKALDHRTGIVHDEVKNVIMKNIDGSDDDGNALLPRHAYLLKKHLSKSTYGNVYLGCVLVRRDIDDTREDLFAEERVLQKDTSSFVQWESTEKLVVLKASSLSRMRKLRASPRLQHPEDPIREIAAMQHLGTSNPHVLGCIEVLQDKDWLYTITPYCSGGDLSERLLSLDCGPQFDMISAAGEEYFGTSIVSVYSEDETINTSPCSSDGSVHSTVMNDESFKSTCVSDNVGRVGEFKARQWFRQLLLGLYHLQEKGVCHREICLENIMVDENDDLLIADFGMSLRIPYNDPNSGFLTDVSEGTHRRLIQAARGGFGSKSTMYTAPEVLERHGAFDSHTIDMWSIGVILFILIVGLAPFELADIQRDKRFMMIGNGRLRELLQVWKISISSEACDLLQNMLWHNPRDRFTLLDIMRHPWVMMDDDMPSKENVPKEMLIPTLDTTTITAKENEHSKNNTISLKAVANKFDPKNKLQKRDWSNFLKPTTKGMLPLSKHNNNSRIRHRRTFSDQFKDYLSKMKLAT